MHAPAELDEKLVFKPYGATLAYYAQHSESIILELSCIGVSYALGKDLAFLRTNSQHKKVCNLFVKDSIAPYLERGALAQLVILSLAGTSSLGSTFDGFLPQLKKVKRVVFTDDDIAQFVLEDTTRAFCFFTAVTAMAGLFCKKHEFARDAFQLKRTMFGKFKFKPCD